MKVLFLTIMVSSCSSLFYPERDYSSIMEEDQLFEPGEDFPVLVGDKDERERELPRYPFRFEELTEEDRLGFELDTKVRGASPFARELYYRYARHLQDSTEKIYFLELPDYEKKQYLRHLGLIFTNVTREEKNSNEKF